MNFFRQLFVRLRTLVRYGHRRAELDEEIQAHLGLRIEELVRDGYAEHEAQYQARLEFGHMDSAKEATWDSWGVRMIVDTVRDFRYAARSVAKHRTFSLTVILTIALGIGINTTVFTLVNAVLFKPVSIPRGDQLVVGCANWHSALRWA